MRVMTDGFKRSKQMESAGKVQLRVWSLLATRRKVALERKSYSREVAPLSNRDGRISVLCLECGHLGHGMFTCPRFWNKTEYNGVEEKPAPVLRCWLLPFATGNPFCLYE